MTLLVTANIDTVNQILAIDQLLLNMYEEIETEDMASLRTVLESKKAELYSDLITSLV